MNDTGPSAAVRLAASEGPGEDRARRTLASAQFSSTVGDGLFYVCSALYFTRIVGMSPLQLGLGLTIAWTLGLVASVPLGHLADRRGPRGVAIVLCVLAGGATAMLLFVHGVASFIALAAVYAVCSKGAQTAQQALLAALTAPARITLVRAFIVSRSNAGLAVGAAAGGLVLTIDTPAAYLTAFALDACSFFVAAVLLARLEAPPPAPAGAAGPVLAVFGDRPYVIVSLVNLVLVLHLPLIDVILPLWVLGHTHAPRGIVACIFVLNTIVVVACQVRVARRVRGLAGAVRSVRYAAAFLLAACCVFAVSSLGSSAWFASAALIAAAGLMTVAEMRQTAANAEISFGLAPASRHGQYQGFFGMGLTAAEAIGPLLLTWMLVYGGAAGWLVLGGLFLLAGFAMGPAVRAAERSIAARAAAGPSTGTPPAVGRSGCGGELGHGSCALERV